MPTATEQDLEGVAITLGEPVSTAGNIPIELDHPGTAWYVEQGAVDVFVVEHENGVHTSSAKHVLRAGAGRLVFGVQCEGTSLTAFAKGLPQTNLRRLALDGLMECASRPEIAAQADVWITDFSAAVAHQIEPRPRSDLLIVGGDELEVEAGFVLSTRPERLTWAQAKGSAYLGTEEADPDGTGLMPLTSSTWLTITEATTVAASTSRDLAGDGRLMQALDEFHRTVLGAEQLNRLLLLADVANEQFARSTHRRQDEEGARRELFGVMGDFHSIDATTDSTLLDALQLVGRHEGIEFRPPKSPRVATGAQYSMRDVANASGVRVRKVRLREEDRWWLGDSGAMLGFRSDDGSPVALLPGVLGRYRAVDPVTGRSLKINANEAGTLEEMAWYFYKPLPKNESVQAKGFVGFVGKSMVGEFGWFALTGLVASLLLLGPPIAMGELTDWVLPSSAGTILVQVVVALFSVTLVATILQVLRGTAMMRLEGRATARGAAATWDRLLSLPPKFFNQYTAGELAVRLAVFHQMRDQISGVVANALLSVVFLLPTFAVLFMYDVLLAWLSVVLGLTALAFTAVIGYLHLSPIRQRFEVSRKLGGELYQFINGVNKLRSAGAESSAFASWARGYKDQQVSKIKIGRLSEHLVAFTAALPSLATALFFGAVLWRGVEQIDLSSFLVVYAISMLFYASIIQLAHSLEAIASVVPGYEQVEPILRALPQGQTDGTATVDLSGHIQFDQVSFRYSEDGPLIIDDVSFEVRPGEFVAIVGESGSGKSTLMRLALGLEDPISGAIYYDERELAYLDRSSVRRQIGMVTQNGSLQPGDILDNIVGMGDDLTIEDAWRAAKLANVDEEIAAMPMGMFTPVSDNSSTFSGGQTQRVRIAAALVRRPRVVFLDEATSWLDARSQAEVMRGIESIAATRIVIAHRLSTIRRAERIYVLQGGRIVQQGDFDGLAGVDGPFRELIERQIV